MEQHSKIEDIVVFRDRSFYCAFPSVVCLPDGELIVAFRRAPNRKRFGAKLKFHTDPNSYLVLVRSRDDGVSFDVGYPWSCLTADGKVLVVYYINLNRDIVGIDRTGDEGRGSCHIAATRVVV